MDFLSALKLFKDWAIKFIPAAINKNREMREEIRAIIGDMADDINGGLHIIIMRLRAAKRLDNRQEFVDYLNNSEGEIFRSFSEFRVCAGIRNLEDRFKRLFDPTRTAVDLSNVSEIQDLIVSLESHERLIFDMLSGNMNRIRDAANSGKEKHTVVAIIDETINASEEKQQKVNTLAREIIDKL